MEVTTLSIKRESNKEKLSVLLIFFISIVVLFLIKDVKKYRIFVHGIYATFLIAMGIIVFNTIKFNVNRFSIFLGSIVALTGILEIIYVFICLNSSDNIYYSFDFMMLLAIATDLFPIIGIYMSIKYIRQNKEISKNTILTFLMNVTIISLLILSIKVFKLMNNMAMDMILFYIEGIISLFILFIAILINKNINQIGTELDDYEKKFLKKIITIIVLSRIPATAHIFIRNFYVEDMLKQVMNNFAIYYLYKYIVHTNIKKPYLKLNQINTQLIQKSNILRHKNQNLIKETCNIEKLRNMLIYKELKLQSTLDSTENCIIVFNDKQEIAYANKTFVQTFKKDNLDENYKIERDIKPIIKNYCDFIKNIDDSFKFNKNIEDMIFTEDNKVFQSIFTPLVIKNETQGTLCILIDKTKKKEFEKKIKEANTRYERFLESIGDGIVVIQNDKKIYVNKACKKIFKDKLNEIKFDIYSENDNLEECYEIDGKMVYVEMNFSKYTKNNEDKIIIVIREITNRKKAQLKLKENQKSYAKFIDILPDGICLVDKNLKISYGNQSLLNMLQIESMKTIKGLNINKIISLSIEDEFLFDSKMKKVMHENKYMLLLEHELIKYDKNKIQVEVNALPFFVDENKHIMLIIKDLTYKKTSQMAEKEILDRLKTDKIKTEFFANMSHELKTPLNVISSSNQLIDALHKNGKIEDYNDNMKSHIELVRQSSYRLQRLISNIIDLTKMESGLYKLKLSKHNIISVVEDLFMKVDEYARKKDISIIFDTDNEEINLSIDKIEIERIMLNLLSNCIKFTDRGGCICVNIYDKKDSLMICVKDNGVGIPENKINIIFEEFAQVDKTLSRKTEGSGIGLSIVKNLVELHQGSVSVKSKEGSGAEFIIIIPIENISNGDYKEDKRIYNIDEKIKMEFSDIYY
ncbi:ATP-binding protein [Romboutsia sedimentorum]|uniref:histidine kinase n=1 Tax=Romboutsia sedimentorum TaxID=1368474 RepID=A0ABT7E7A7_9FIRM|nr:ATP-binding protein [Romboutsia sedimentorum]MDK2562818.1 ATP-binding protein [Romboutsia sedimentorum]